MTNIHGICGNTFVQFQFTHCLLNNTHCADRGGHLNKVHASKLLLTLLPLEQTRSPPRSLRSFSLTTYLELKTPRKVCVVLLQHEHFFKRICSVHTQLVTPPNERRPYMEGWYRAMFVLATITEMTTQQQLPFVSFLIASFHSSATWQRKWRILNDWQTCSANKNKNIIWFSNFV